jgi:anti-sigma-K factor RskA
LRTRGDLQRAAGERQQLQEALAMLSSSQPQMVQFGGHANAPRGSVFVNKNGGFVLTGSHMPRIPEDKAFELWLIPKTGSPIPAGVFLEMRNNSVVHAYREPVQINQISGVAVSVEPKQGVLAPTSKPFLFVPLS